MLLNRDIYFTAVEAVTRSQLQKASSIGKNVLIRKSEHCKLINVGLHTRTPGKIVTQESASGVVWVQTLTIILDFLVLHHNHLLSSTSSLLQQGIHALIKINQRHNIKRFQFRKYPAMHTIRMLYHCQVVQTEK